MKVMLQEITMEQDRSPPEYAFDLPGGGRRRLVQTAGPMLVRIRLEAVIVAEEYENDDRFQEIVGELYGNSIFELLPWREGKGKARSTTLAALLAYGQRKIIKKKE